MDDVRETARLYISKGWYPIPLNPGTKECRDAKWRESVYSETDFSPESNIGIRLVKASDTRHLKLVGVDLDAPETVLVAEHFLPRTNAVWGRASKRISQLLFVAPFEKPIVYKDLCKGGTTLVEIRVDHQSMAPPSIHPNGEQLHWHDPDNIEAAVVDPNTLLRAVQLIATTALVIRYYNPEGHRHDWGLALAGSLRNLGLSEEEANQLITLAAKFAGDTKIRDRLQEFKTTYAHSDEDPLAGLRRLAELVEKGEAFADSLRRIWGSGTDFNVNDKGKILPNDQENIRRALTKIGVSFSFNLFSNKMYVKFGEEKRVLEDDVMDRLWLEVDRRFGFRPSRDFFDTVVKDWSRRTTFHPVREYLDSLTWDGVARIDTWLVEYCGAGNTDYTRTVGALVLIAAVRRVRQPGAKFDELLVLESGQGLGKSTALRVLCPEEEWFSDDLPLNLDSKQIIERTAGKWIIEAPELSGMRRAQIEGLKALLSRQIDGPVRMAYARLPVEVARQFIVIGTTNAHTYLRDLTGNRRFWPARVNKIDVAKLRADRDQLWAEAAHRESQGGSIRLPTEMYVAAALQQDRRLSEDPWEQILGGTLNSTEVKQRILPSVLWDALGIPPAARDDRGMERINSIMQKLGFRRISIRDEKARVVKGWGRDHKSLIESIEAQEPE